jgi:hypothetical protein
MWLWVDALWPRTHRAFREANFLTFHSVRREMVQENGSACYEQSLWEVLCASVYLTVPHLRKWNSVYWWDFREKWSYQQWRQQNSKMCLSVSSLECRSGEVQIKSFTLNLLCFPFLSFFKIHIYKYSFHDFCKPDVSVFFWVVITTLIYIYKYKYQYVQVCVTQVVSQWFEGQWHYRTAYRYLWTFLECPRWLLQIRSFVFPPMCRDLSGMRGTLSQVVFSSSCDFALEPKMIRTRTSTSGLCDFV